MSFYNTIISLWCQDYNYYNVILYAVVSKEMFVNQGIVYQKHCMCRFTGTVLDVGRVLCPLCYICSINMHTIYVHFNLSNRSMSGKWINHIIIHACDILI